MKSIEQRVKEMILTRHKTVKEFSNICGLPYGTIDGILRRGFGNSNVENVFAICKCLGISADELANGKIVLVEKSEKNHLFSSNLCDVVEYVRMNFDDMHELKIDEKKLSPEELYLLIDCVELSIELIKRKRERDQK